MGTREQCKVTAGSIYLFLAGLHRLWRGRKPAKSLPILVIGSLRAGGGGKTPAVEWFARQMPEAAILVHPTPDEQGILERGFPGRVFAARALPDAWDAAKAAGFSWAIADGGYQDPRLDGGVRLLLWDELPPESPGQILPFGRWRELGLAGGRADIHLIRQGLEPYVEGMTVHSYQWKTEFPEEIGQGPVLLACGVGNPERVRAELLRGGVEILAESIVSDHGRFDSRKIAQIEARFEGVSWIGTEKDRPRWPSSARSLHALMRSWHPDKPSVLLDVVRRELALRGADPGPES